MRLPSAYQGGYDKASMLNPLIAAKYIEHTVIGDPLADAAIGSLARFRQAETQRFIQAGMEQDAKRLADAPQALQDLFAQIAVPPAWFDPAEKRVYAGCRAFHDDSDLFLLAFLGDVIVRGFATMISKSFFMTGRIWDYGVRRLQRNILHLIEIMMPGGLERQGEGWKLSVRIRLVHAQVRRMLSLSEEWDQATYGTPLSAAHIALASAGFSAQLLAAAIRLGARVVHVYRDGRETALSMSRHPPFRAILAMARKYRPWGIDLERTLSRLEHRDGLTARLAQLAQTFANLDRLPYDKLTLPDFAAFWNAMIESGHRVFGHFPSDPLLNVRFEDIQANPEGQIRRLIRFISPEFEDDT